MTQNIIGRGKLLANCQLTLRYHFLRSRRRAIALRNDAVRLCDCSFVCRLKRCGRRCRYGAADTTGVPFYVSSLVKNSPAKLILRAAAYSWRHKRTVLVTLTLTL